MWQFLAVCFGRLVLFSIHFNMYNDSSSNGFGWRKRGRVPLFSIGSCCENWELLWKLETVAKARFCYRTENCCAFQEIIELVTRVSLISMTFFTLYVPYFILSNYPEILKFPQTLLSYHCCMFCCSNPYCLSLHMKPFFHWVQYLPWTQYTSVLKYSQVSLTIFLFTYFQRRTLVIFVVHPPYFATHLSVFTLLQNSPLSNTAHCLEEVCKSEHTTMKTLKIKKKVKGGDIKIWNPRP